VRTSYEQRRAEHSQLLPPDPRPLTPAFHWFVVQSNPREEERAQHFLEEKGLRTYLPRMETVSLRGLKSVTVQKPLFPGYLFCHFDPNESLAYVRWTRGVKKLLPESVNPVPITVEVIDAIRSLEQKDGIVRKQPLKKNDRVRIARGPLKDVLGIFDYWASDRGRVRVLLNFITYQASVELHHSLLEKVA
jgi:transcriptional antiterminator RfaH